eukprot:TRINITY_DN8245_c0_g1_i4.p2 TRINITY_DN8245_c0_g1~~TRINITY_DN8245_c0_g1_i4.p2  ORF type:complete len:267 (+),score=79.32 TRINITY_DN8245_c0_g1_i4:1070-1870(+)
MSRVLVQETTWKHTAGMVLFWVVTMFCHTSTMNVVNKRLRSLLPPETHPPLPDLGHDFIPKMDEGANDVLLALQVLLCIGVTVSCASGRMEMLFRYALAYSVLVWLRSCTILVTTLPATGNHCQHPKQIKHPLLNAFLGVVTGGAASTHCGDLMFSGHTIALVLSMMITLTYQERRSLKVAAVLLFIADVYCIIATRSHYTVDIVVGVYVTLTTWHLTPATWHSFVSALSTYEPLSLPTHNEPYLVEGEMAVLDVDSPCEDSASEM